MNFVVISITFGVLIFVCKQERLETESPNKSLLSALLISSIFFEIWIEKNNENIEKWSKIIVFCLEITIFNIEYYAA